MSINRVVLTGNLTREPDLRTTTTGLPVLSLGLAVNDRRKNRQTGQWEDKPNFIECKMFGDRATGVTPYLHKGSKVSIEGKLSYSQWTNNQNEKRSKIEVLVDEIEFMQQAQNTPNPAYNSAPSPAPTNYAPQATSAPQAVYTPAQAPVQQAAPMQTQMQGMPAPVVDASIYEEDIPF